MSLPSTMKAVVVKGEGAALEEVPLPSISEGKFLIKVEAAGANPADWKHIAYKLGSEGSIVGCDVAGKVVKLGPQVKGFEVGDVVYGLVHGCSVKHPENGGFAQYALLDDKLSLKTPQGLKLSGQDRIPAGPLTTIEAAASLPISLYTAGQVLTYHLGLKNEWQPSKPQYDFPLLIWGGATALGQFILQLAKKMHGYTKIIVVASRKHEKQLKDLGADELFDYHDADVVQQIKKKYEYLPQLIDAVSAPESFTEVYKLGSKNGPTTLLQLTTMSDALIKPEERNSNVKVDGVMVFMATGVEIPFGGVTLPASPAVREATIKFLQFIGPKVNAGEIHPIAIQTFHGLEVVPELFKDIEQGKNANVKYVTVLK